MHILYILLNAVNARLNTEEFKENAKQPHFFSSLYGIVILPSSQKAHTVLKEFFVLNHRIEECQLFTWRPWTKKANSTLAVLAVTQPVDCGSWLYSMQHWPHTPASDLVLKRMLEHSLCKKRLEETGLFSLCKLQCWGQDKPNSSLAGSTGGHQDKGSGSSRWT